MKQKLQKPKAAFEDLTKLHTIWICQNHCGLSQEAQRHIGVKEIKGAKHNTFYLKTSASVKELTLENMGKTMNNLVWCFCRALHQEQSECKLPKYWMRAKDWLNWGQKTLMQPCIAGHFIA